MKNLIKNINFKIALLFSIYWNIILFISFEFATVFFKNYDVNNFLVYKLIILSSLSFSLFSYIYAMLFYSKFKKRLEVEFSLFSMIPFFNLVILFMILLNLIILPFKFINSKFL
jgi:hypothetical protein